MSKKTLCTFVSHSIAVAFVGAAVMLPMAAAATEYQWAGGSTGNWSVEGNWSPNGVPGDGDLVHLIAGTYEIAIDRDVSLTQLGPKSFGATDGNRTIDANNHTVTITTTGYAGYFLSPTIPVFTFKNGTLNASAGAGYQLGHLSNSSSTSVATFLLDNATYTGTVDGASGCSFIISNGSTYNPIANWTFPKARNANNTAGLLRVTGAGSMIKSSSYSLSFPISFIDGGVSGSRFEVLDHAVAEVSALNQGSSSSGTTNVVVYVDNASLICSGNYGVGMDASGETWGHEIHLVGDNALLTVGGTMKVMQLDDNKFFFTPGRDGYTDEYGVARAPLQISTLNFTDRTKGTLRNAPTKLVIEPEAWMIYHPGETITLLQLTNPNRPALDALTNNVVVSISHPEWFDGDLVVDKTSDQMSITITAPNIAEGYEPTAPVIGSVDAPFCNSTDSTQISAVISDYGNVMTEVDVRLVYSTSLPGLTDGSGTELALEDGLSGALPVSETWTVSGLTAGTQYYANLIVVNERGLAATNYTHFITKGATAETYTQKEAVDGNWQTDGYWDVPGYPMPEDTVSLKSAGWGSTFSSTLTMQGDAGCVKLGSIQYATATINLNGWNFTILGNSDFWGGVYGYQPDSLELNDLSNYFAMRGPGVFDASGNRGFRFAQENAGGACGELSLEDCVVYKGSFETMVNGSRIFVRGGSEWIPSANFAWTTHNKDYGYVCVTGENSKVTSPDYSFTVDNGNSGLFALDGGSYELKNLNLGTGTYTNTFLVLSNGQMTAENFTVGSAAGSGHDASIVIAGDSSIAVSGTTTLYANSGTSISINIPSDGIDGAVWSTDSLVIGERTGTAYADTSISIECSDWIKNNPKSVITLVELEHPNASALSAIKDMISFKSRKGTAILSVSQDGTRLDMTAPNDSGLIIIVR